MKQLYENVSINGTRYKLATESKITYKTTEGRLEKGISCSFDRFLMKPGKVLFVEELSLKPEDEFFDSMKRYIMNGATTILTITTIQDERTFEKELNRSINGLAKSPIDYVIGIRTDASQLTPEFIRKCARYRIPLVIAEFKTEEIWNDSVFEWTIQANFPYGAALIPDFSFLKTFQEDKIEQERLRLLSEAQVKGLDACFYQELVSEKELSSDMLKRTGIYPMKDCLASGADFDYNLYLQNSSNQVEEDQILDYDGEDPIISGLRGKLLKVNDKIVLKVGYGKHLTIHKPSFFTANDRNNKRSVRRSFGAWSVLNKLSR
ncbi:hypothetical protein [Guptibacillus hwajinpoensis]|uniref:Uncharacterized protein n=1 Tax=Guptibacillus hwajinpoensis TaxID=208199 RepID=A0A0J6FUZ1_9BACL|nr:hypothetical protein [Alkalihalobacillus macyae]KMM38167.1 hypothetical protein AB986_02240 [Alkalihalobacillus macyae]